jgi:cobalt transporter subunit CbtB
MTNAVASSRTVAVPARLLPALFALAFGAFMVFGVGFSHLEAAHNAAHDGRHAFAFPCH